jgi:Na+/proline symporter
VSAYGWSAIGAMILFSVIGSLAYKFIQNKIESFYVMDRQAPAIMIAGTFIASWLSMATFIGAMAMAWRWGAVNEMWFYGSLWGITMFTFLIAIPLRRGGFVTVPDFFGDVYSNNKLRTVTVIVLLISQLGIMVLQIMGAGKALEMAVGLPYWVGVLAFGLLISVYVTLGGMYAVVITDTLMLIVFCVAIFVAWPFTLNSIGGWEALTHTLPAMKPGIWNWNGTDGLPFFYLFGIFLTWFAGAGASPYLVSRAYVAKMKRHWLTDF